MGGLDGQEVMDNSNQNQNQFSGLDGQENGLQNAIDMNNQMLEDVIDPDSGNDGNGLQNVIDMNNQMLENVIDPDNGNDGNGLQNVIDMNNQMLENVIDPDNGNDGNNHAAMIA